MTLKFSIVLLIFSLSVQAKELGMMSAKTAYRETNEGIYMRSLELIGINHRRELFWPYEGSEIGTHDLGADVLLNDGHSRDFDITGQRFRLIYGHQFNEFSALSFKAGAHQYKARSRYPNSGIGEIEHSNPVFETTYYLRVGRAKNRFLVEYDNVYLRLQLPAGVSNHLRYLNFSYDTNIDISATHRVSGGATQRFYSDSNQRIEMNLNTVHRFSENPLIPWLGVGVQYLGSKKNLDGYWTPRSQSSIGPRLQWSYWHSEVFAAGLYSNINYYYNSTNKDYGIGHYTAAMFWIGNRNEFHGILELVRMDSQQDLGSPWNENDIVFTLSYPW